MEQEQLKRGMMRLARKMRKLNLCRLLDALSQEEFIALEYICRFSSGAEGGKGITVSELARQMAAAPPAASRLLHSLERKGFVRRETDPDDRRNTRVSLTREGLRAHGRAAGALDGFANRVVARLGEDKMGALIALMEEMSDIMADELRPEGEPLPAQAMPTQP